MKKVFLLITIIILSLNSFSQESSFYVGYKSMREANISYDYSLGSDVQIGAAIGYIFASDGKRAYGNLYPDGTVIDALSRKKNQQGISLSSIIKFRKGKRERLLLTFSFEYQYLRSGNYTYLEKGYSGGYQSLKGGEYSEFKHTYNNFTFLFGVHHEFLKNNMADVYFECGMAYKYIVRTYSIDGYYEDQRPSNNIEFLNNIAPTFRIGLNFKIFDTRGNSELPNKKGQKGTSNESKSKVKLM